MRFTSIITAGLLAVVTSAQSDSATTTASDVVSTTSSSGPVETSESAATKCINACDVDDVNCKAACIAVPSPDNQNVNATTDCVADCPKGKGTADDNKAYGDCVNDCIGQYYFTSSGAGSSPTSTSGSGSGSSGSATPSVTSVESTITSGGSTMVTSVPSTVSDGDAEETGSGSATSSSMDGGANVFGPVGSVGLLGLFAGFLAL